MSSAPSSSSTRFATYRRIAESLRDQILGQEYSPGQRLPSKGVLMQEWHASSFTVHSALQALIKEGWIESVRGSGTFVAQPQNRFVSAGIYHGSEICSENETPFARRVHVALVKKFRELGKATQVFMDTRPPAEQGTLLPALADAVFHRRIQCLIFPLASRVNLPELSRLKMPTATLSSPAPSVINYDMADFFQRSAQSLAGGGCRTVGLLSTYHAEIVDGRRDPFYSLFRKAAHDAGLQVMENWVSTPADFVPIPKIEREGYASFTRLWKNHDAPDGLIVYPDTMVRGVIIAILEQGVAAVTQRMKFLFHRNAHLDILCPFPVTWAISDEDALATELVAQIEKQFEGKRTSSVLLPYRLERNAAC
jgi:DNA-binding LacI/PurR family transcriptional regulator